MSVRKPLPAMRALRAFAVVALFGVMLLAGCSQPKDPAPVVEPDAGFGPATFDGEKLRVDVAVPIVMFGFPPATVAQLAAEMDPEEIKQLGYTHPMSFPPLEASGAEEDYPLPVLPTAHFQVHAAPADLEEAFLAFAAAAKAPNGTMLDGTRVEAWLAEQLPLHGFPLDANAPTMVLLHGGGGLLPADHGWRYEYRNGYLDRVRAFGERTPLLVFDASAAVDPYVGTVEDYFSPIDNDDVGALGHLVRDATHFRLLQGAIYPISLAPCHAITFVLAVRAGTLAESLAIRPASDYMHADLLKGAFENLTGAGQVFADTKTLLLPVDDPALDAFTRGGFNTVEEARWWVTQNWDKYWVPHDGCDGYVSIVVLGDTDTGGGIGMYDIRQGQRIAISTDGYLSRLQGGVDRQQLAPGYGVGRTPSRYSYELPGLYFSHEGGHLIGQRHPHDINRGDGYEGISAFSAVYSVMSYQTLDRTVDFGVVDHANWWRNRLGFALQAASAADGNSDELAAALAHAADYQWEEAYWDLAPLLPPGGPRA
jgi:hypothetical protein